MTMIPLFLIMLARITRLECHLHSMSKIVNLAFYRSEKNTQTIKRGSASGGMQFLLFAMLNYVFGGQALENPQMQDFLDRCIDNIKRTFSCSYGLTAEKAEDGLHFYLLDESESVSGECYARALVNFYLLTQVESSAMTNKDYTELYRFIANPERTIKRDDRGEYRSVPLNELKEFLKNMKKKCEINIEPEKKKKPAGGIFNSFFS